MMPLQLQPYDDGLARWPHKANAALYGDCGGAAQHVAIGDDGDDCGLLNGVDGDMDDMDGGDGDAEIVGAQQPFELPSLDWHSRRLLRYDGGWLNLDDVDLWRPGTLNDGGADDDGHAGADQWWPHRFRRISLRLPLPLYLPLLQQPLIGQHYERPNDLLLLELLRLRFGMLC